MGNDPGVDGLSKVLDDRARASAPGQFIELSHGMVHYEMGGLLDRQVVVLISGFSVPYFVWDPTFDALVDAGFNVLRYDLYGRGFSDRPNIKYGQDLFDEQLWELLVRLGLRERVDLVGLSMGGAIAVTFAARHPERVRRLCLVDPAGLPWKQSFVSKAVLVPGIGELLIKLLGDRVVLSNLRKYFYRKKQYKAFEQEFKVQMQYPGLKRALLSTNRSGITQGAEQDYRKVGKSNIPVCLVWGKEDKVIPFELNGRVRELLPQTEFHAVEQAAHIPHYERPEAVNPILIDFFSR
jgi:pimeloyl-ACP methyl ester carboxylesterase